MSEIARGAIGGYKQTRGMENERVPRREILDFAKIISVVELK